MIDLSDLTELAEVEEDDGVLLPNGTPSPYTPEHSEAAAHVLGYDSAAQREQVDPPKKKRGRRSKAEIEAARAAEATQLELASAAGALDPETDASAAAVLEPTPFDGFPSPPLKAAPVGEFVPEVTDTQVLVDEIHFLREDIRENTAELRKLALAFERRMDVQVAGALPKSSGD